MNRNQKDIARKERDEEEERKGKRKEITWNSDARTRKERENKRKRKGPKTQKENNRRIGGQTIKCSRSTPLPEHTQL